ncbi:aconitase X swivel domain-containing protein [Sphingopyxis sp. MSC1_008]|jgi:predicted aconitase with swiveling domain
MNFTALKPLSPGTARGPIARLSAPLSLWGGLDLDDGTICDVNHPQCGQSLSGKVLAMRAARGSSSSSSALVEAARRSVAPCAIILVRPDPILVIGSLVAADLYGIQIPIILVTDKQWETLPSNGAAVVEASEETGRVRFLS